MTQKIKPTDAELEILNILWDYGPNSVRFVNDKLNEVREVGYTTTLKIMQIMTEKGLATRDTSTKKHTYQAAIARESTQYHLLNKLADLAFGGSAIQLAMRALDDNRATKEEIDALRALLDKMEDKDK